MSCHDGFADSSFPTREKSSADAAGHAASAPKFLAFRGRVARIWSPISLAFGATRPTHIDRIACRAGRTCKAIKGITAIVD
jgi:hypothetical protein